MEDLLRELLGEQPLTPEGTEVCLGVLLMWYRLAPNAAIQTVLDHVELKGAVPLLYPALRGCLGEEAKRELLKGIGRREPRVLKELLGSGGLSVAEEAMVVEAMPPEDRRSVSYIGRTSLGRLGLCVPEPLGHRIVGFSTDLRTRIERHWRVVGPVATLVVLVIGMLVYSYLPENVKQRVSFVSDFTQLCVYDFGGAAVLWVVIFAVFSKVSRKR